MKTKIILWVFLLGIISHQETFGQGPFTARRYGKTPYMERVEQNWIRVKTIKADSLICEKIKEAYKLLDSAKKAHQALAAYDQQKVGKSKRFINGGSYENVEAKLIKLDSLHKQASKRLSLMSSEKRFNGISYEMKTIWYEIKFLSQKLDYEATMAEGWRVYLEMKIKQLSKK